MAELLGQALNRVNIQVNYNRFERGILNEKKGIYIFVSGVING
jgi:hypothetical protein